MKEREEHSKRPATPPGVTEKLLPDGSKLRTTMRSAPRPTDRPWREPKPEVAK